MLDDLWRLELLVVPLAALLLVAVLGVRLAAGPVLCAAIALAGALAGLRVAGILGDPSLLATVPAAGVALALGIELPALLAARWEDEMRLVQPLQALRSTVAEGAVPLCFAALAAVLAGAALVATAFEPAASMALGCALASAWALLACMVVMPALFALDGQREGGSDGGLRHDRRLAHALAAAPRALARGRVRSVVAAGLAVLVALALTYPALDAGSRPLEARDLPRDSAPAQAAKIAGPGAPQSDRAKRTTQDRPPAGGDGAESADDSLAGDLPLAAALAAGLLALAFALRSRSWRCCPPPRPVGLWRSSRGQPS